MRCINFTGSTRIGRMLAERAGRHLKRIVLELGGYNPLIVLRDADLDYAVDATAFAAFLHQGQICMNARKVIVERPILDDFVERLTAGARREGRRPERGGHARRPAHHRGRRAARDDDVADAVARGAPRADRRRADGNCS